MSLRDHVKALAEVKGVSNVTHDDTIVTLEIQCNTYTISVGETYPRGSTDVFTATGDCIAFSGLTVVQIAERLLERAAGAADSAPSSRVPSEQFEYQGSEVLDAVEEDMQRFDAEYGKKSCSRRTLAGNEWITIRFSLAPYVDAQTAKAWSIDNRPIEMVLKFMSHTYLEATRAPEIEILRAGAKFQFGQQLRNKAVAYLEHRWAEGRFVPYGGSIEKASLGPLAVHENVPLPKLTKAQKEVHKLLVEMGFAADRATFAASECKSVEEAVIFDVDAHIRYLNSGKLTSLGDGEAPYDPVTDPKKAIYYDPRKGFLVHMVQYLVHRLETLASYCVICDKPHKFGSGMLQASVCSRDICVFAFQELNVGVDAADSIAVEGGVIDLLMNIFKAAALSPRADKILHPFPHVIDPTNPQRVILDPKTRDMTKLADVVKKFPSVQVVLGCDNLQQLKARLESKDKDVFPVLEWVINSNRSFIIKIPTDRQMKSVTTPHQFLLVTAPPDKQRIFSDLKRKHGTKFAWHGSGIENWHAILRQGLRNLSNTDLMTSGAAHGAGIYFAPDAATSVGYCRQSAVACGSAVNKIPGLICDKGMICLALCEIVADQINDHGWCWTVADEQRVMTRFFFVFEDQSSGQSMSGTSSKDSAFVDEVRRAMAFYDVQ